MNREIVRPQINPVHESILGIVREVYAGHGARLLSGTPMLNTQLGITQDGSTYLSFEGDPPTASRLLTSDGSYSPLGSFIGGPNKVLALRDLFFELRYGGFNVEKLDADEAAVVRRAVRAEVSPRSSMWRISPLPVIRP